MNEWEKKKETAWEKQFEMTQFAMLFVVLSLCFAVLCIVASTSSWCVLRQRQSEQRRPIRDRHISTSEMSNIKAHLNIRRRRCHHLLLLVVRVMLKAHQIDWAGYRGQVVPVPVLVKWKTASVVLATDKVRWVLEKKLKLTSPPWNTPVLHSLLSSRNVIHCWLFNVPYSIAADAVDAAEDENELVLIMFGSAGGRGGIVLLQLGSLSVEWRSRLGTGEQGEDVSSHSSRHSTTESLFLSFSVMVFARRGKRERERERERESGANCQSCTGRCTATTPTPTLTLLQLTGIVFRLSVCLSVCLPSFPSFPRHCQRCHLSTHVHSVSLARAHDQQSFSSNWHSPFMLSIYGSVQLSPPPPPPPAMIDQ